MYETLPSATVRTQVSVPLRFPDGYTASACVSSFNGLVDGREHLALGLGDWLGARAQSEPRPGAGHTRSAACRG